MIEVKELTPPSCRHTDTCRICGSENLIQILDLGLQPPANAYLSPEQLDLPEARFPLVLWFCRNCSLVQLRDVVDPSVLFKNYHFTSSSSRPTVEHFRDYAEKLVRPLIDNPHNLVVEIGGNDGSLLSNLKGKARLLNIDPASNLAPLSEARGVPVLSEFFNSKVAVEVVHREGFARVIVANNVFAHVDNICDAMTGAALLLHERGTLIFEVHWVGHMIATQCFDQLYHEHLCYHSLHAIKRMVDAVRMVITDVAIVPMQGQSLQVTVRQEGRPSQAVADMLATEKKMGLTYAETFHGFARTVETNRKAVLELLRDLKAQGKSIVGYGASAKGMTLLNYYGLGPETLDYITDTTPLKQGLFSPGSHIPIVPPDILKDDPPDYALVLAWNFLDAILAQEQALIERGTKFIVTVPKLQVFP